MIRSVKLRRFKRFEDCVFDLTGHVVLVGPNNTGKTTLLQAISAWSQALERWKSLNDFQRHGGAYTRAPITRQQFAAVPLRSFDLLWWSRDVKGGAMEVAVTSDRGWTVTMEFIAESSEQIYVRPKPDVEPQFLRELSVPVAYVPPMSGLGADEHVLPRPKLEQLLGMGRPGEVIRNLLLGVSRDDDRWGALTDSIRRLFGFELERPDDSGPDIVAQYRARPGGPAFDIASGGSGFQQVLMLLTFLHTRPGAVLLVDEPDAHLHVLLQGTIFDELRSVAAQRRSQLVVATHSEVIIDGLDLRELLVLLDGPRRLGDDNQRQVLTDALRVLTNTDVMIARQAPGVLYAEGHTDLAILREWARVLGHPAYQWLASGPFWKPSVDDHDGRLRHGIQSDEHFQALRLVREDIRAFELVDGDSPKRETPVTGEGFQRMKWRRKEIENYLMHPAALARYVERILGPGGSRQALEDLQSHFEKQLPAAFLEDPFGDNPTLVEAKGRKHLLPPALEAAGIHGVEYTQFYQIASLMLPEEIHPEVTEKLDGLVNALRLT